MNREDLIAMARNAGFPAADYPSLVSDKEWEALERFFQAAYAAGVANRKPWVGLTVDECVMIGVATGLEMTAIHMIESKLKEKNT